MESGKGNDPAVKGINLTLMAAPNQARPLELVSFNAHTGKFEVGEEALAVLRGVRAPLAVVAVCGRARQGKSYILVSAAGGGRMRECKRVVECPPPPPNRTAPPGTTTHTRRTSWCLRAGGRASPLAPRTGPAPRGCGCGQRP